MKEPINIGLIGLGMISSNHIKGYTKIPEKAKIVAVCDVKEELAKRTAKELGANVYTDYDKMLEHEDIDAVDIMVPHHKHVRIATDVAKAGKHILLEKPIARNVKEADQILDVTKETNVHMMVANNLLFHSAIRRTKDYIEKNLLGKIVLAKAHSLGWFFYNVGISKYRRSIEETGGGCFIDTGTHFVYLLRNLVGDVERVSFFKGNLLNELHPSIDKTDFIPEGEDLGIALLEFKNKALGTLTVSYSIRLAGWKMFWPPGWDQRIDIYGSEGAINLDLIKNSFKVFLEKEDIPEYARGCSYVPLLENFGSTFPSEIDHFVTCLIENKDFMVGVRGEDARKDIEIVEACYKSFETKNPVSLPLKSE